MSDLILIEWTRASTALVAATALYRLTHEQVEEAFLPWLRAYGIAVQAHVHLSGDIRTGDWFLSVDEEG